MFIFGVSFIIFVVKLVMKLKQSKFLFGNYIGMSVMSDMKIFVKCGCKFNFKKFIKEVFKWIVMNYFKVEKVVDCLFNGKIGLDDYKGINLLEL